MTAALIVPQQSPPTVTESVVPCDWCAGKGSFVDHQFQDCDQCEECNGSGEQVVLSCVLTVPETLWCRSCNGMGVVYTMQPNPDMDEWEEPCPCGDGLAPPGTPILVKVREREFMHHACENPPCDGCRLAEQMKAPAAVTLAGKLAEQVKPLDRDFPDNAERDCCEFWHVRLVDVRVLAEPLTEQFKWLACTAGHDEVGVPHREGCFHSIAGFDTVSICPDALWDAIEEAG